MARGTRKATDKNDNGALLGFEQTLWAATDKQRDRMNVAEYKHVALGLIFLKYIFDTFQELYIVLARKQEYIVLLREYTVRFTQEFNG